MSFQLSVISGYNSAATQFEVLINPDTFHRFKIPLDGYLNICNNGRSLIVHAKSNSAIPLNSVAIDPRTHAMTLYVAHGDKVTCRVVTEIKPISKITVRLHKDSSIISYPRLSKSLYVSPGYRIITPSGPGVIEEGIGLYIYDSQAIVGEVLNIDSSIKANSQHEMLPSTMTINIDFCHMGIGGLREQMTTLIRQVLISRIINKSMREQYRVKDIRGILLYGPPGTGKTLIARNIGKIIPNAVIQKVNGPELSSRYYGDTEANVRKIFDDAKANPSKLHVII